MYISKRILFSLSAIIAISFIFVVNRFVDFDMGGHFEGFYLIRNSASGKYEFLDHLFVGREKRIIFAIDLSNSYFKKVHNLLPKHHESYNHLHCDWNPRDGNGMVSSYFADGSALVTYLGRYLDEEKEVHGLFVGGGLPDTVESNINYNMNNSGMTYFDGKRWYHVWCSVNEGIGSTSSDTTLTPANWEFLGSKVERKSDSDVILTSSHKASIDGAPIRIDRRMHFAAGETYFTLEIKLTNIGTAPVSYNYMYGDEPWVGYYGTSLGDVGWVKDRIVNYEELIDTARYSFIGMADIGNRVIGERPVYTNLADFLEWFGPELPLYAYFTNDLNHMPEKDKKVPLESNVRFLGLLWRRSLAPAETSTIKVAVGMARFNPKTGIPEKPDTNWK